MDTLKADIPANDILDGARDYATFTGFRERRCYYLLERGLLPGAKLGQRWIGSKETVRKYLAEVLSGAA